ncbi:hypothetical protein Acsp02_79340 [Actinoplanes sp. NBRC 103695]|nr:hypothetical protein Acsp02_79340 [Actinoplanes sp. NBRC 103695]
MLLRGVVGRVDHVGVEAHPGHHGEALLADGTDVDAAASTLENDLDGGGEVAGETQVGGQQVAGAGGQHGQGDVRPCQGGDTGHHGAVTAAREHELGAVPYGLGGLTGSRVVHCGLQPPGLRPARGGQRVGDGAAQFVEVGHLHRVHDDR